MGLLDKITYKFAIKTFHLFEKYLKLHVTPVHFYSPIPNTDNLDASVYEKIYDCISIDWNLDVQLDFLTKIFYNYYNEYFPVENSGLSMVDSFVLYSMIRKYKPNIIIEIGAGNSTKIALEAVAKNRMDNHPTQFYSIEPYPADYLKDIYVDGYKLIEKKVQDIEISFLKEADLLFIDSSHVSKINSDVNYQILEIIPSLKTGSIVHWHDILIPSNYSKLWINNGNMFFNESYMLHAFMSFNRAFKIIWSSMYMQLNHPGKMKKQFSYLSPDNIDQQNTSFWIQKVE